MKCFKWILKYSPVIVDSFLFFLQFHFMHFWTVYSSILKHKCLECSLDCRFYHYERTFAHTLCPHLIFSFSQCCFSHNRTLFPVQFSHSIVSESLQPHGLQHTRLPCPSPAPGVCSNSCPSSQWCHPTFSSSVVPFSSNLQSFPASGSFPVSQLFTSGGQNIGVSASASVLPMNIHDWFPSGWTGLIFLQSKGLSRVFSNTTVQKHQFFGTQLSL